MRPNPRVTRTKSQIYGLFNSAHRRVAVRVAKMIISPPMVGVPVLAEVGLGAVFPDILADLHALTCG